MIKSAHSTLATFLLLSSHKKLQKKAGKEMRRKRKSGQHIPCLILSQFLTEKGISERVLKFHVTQFHSFLMLLLPSLLEIPCKKKRERRGQKLESRSEE